VGKAAAGQRARGVDACVVDVQRLPAHSVGSPADDLEGRARGHHHGGSLTSQGFSASSGTFGWSALIGEAEAVVSSSGLHGFSRVGEVGLLRRDHRAPVVRRVAWYTRESDRQHSSGDFVRMRKKAFVTPRNHDRLDAEPGGEVTPGQG